MVPTPLIVLSTIHRQLHNFSYEATTYSFTVFDLETYGQKTVQDVSMNQQNAFHRKILPGS